MATRAVRSPRYDETGDYSGDYEQPVNLPVGSGFAEALSSYLAQGGARSTNPRGKAGMRYQSGSIRGMTQDQAVDRAKGLWANASPAVRQKYEGRSASLADSQQQAIPAPSSRTRQPDLGVTELGRTANPAATAGAGRGTPVSPGPVATPAVSPPAVPNRSTAMAKGAVAPQVPMTPGGAVDWENMGVASRTGEGAVPGPQKIAGIPTSDSVYLGETPPGPGWTLIGSQNGQKKWAKGAETTAANASAAAQTTANNLASDVARAPKAVAVPAPRYNSAGLGMGVTPADGSGRTPEFAAYQATRKALPEMTSADRAVSYPKVKDFEDRAMAANAAEERRKRLNPLAR